VFCTQTGGFIDRSNLRRHFERLGKLGAWVTTSPA
jgi:hypothetical protein